MPPPGCAGWRWSVCSSATGSSSRESPSIDAAGGFKEIGEGGVIGTVAAVTNAVADALAGLGVNVNRIPLTPDRVLALIEGASSREGR